MNKSKYYQPFNSTYARSCDVIAEHHPDLTFDINKPEDVKKLKELRDLNTRTGVAIDILTSFDVFLDAGVAHVTYGDRFVLLSNTFKLVAYVVDLETYCVYVVADGQGHGYHIDSINRSIDVIERSIEFAPAAVLLSSLSFDPNATISKTIADRYFYLLINADLGTFNQEPYSWNGTVMVRNLYDTLARQFTAEPCVSFNCLQRFYAGSDPDAETTDINTVTPLESILVRIANGEITIPDYTLSDVKRVTKRDADKFYAKNVAPIPPGPGYTLLDDNGSYNDPYRSLKWHRPSSVVLNDKATKYSLLFGQDDNTYFGVELPKKVNSVADAFTVLTPAHVHTAVEQRRQVVRQGEWFVVSRKNTEVPVIEDCLLTFEDTSPSDSSFYVSLGRDSEDSAKHMVLTTDGRVSKAGVVYALTPVLVHERGDHPDLKVPYGWYSFHKNTALRAFSQEGVD